MIIKTRSIFGIIAVAILLPFLQAKQADQQPDILLIMPDQWRGGALSILDCASCIRARYGFLTGLFPQASGVVGFRAKPITVPTLPVRDPLEERDLSSVKAHSGKLLDWRAKLINRLKNRPEGFVQNGKLIAGRPYEPLNAGTLRK